MAVFVLMLTAPDSTQPASDDGKSLVDNPAPEILIPNDPVEWREVESSFSPSESPDEPPSEVDTLSLICRPTEDTETPILSINQNLKSVDDCTYQDRVYRRYQKAEFQKALGSMLTYLASLQEDLTAQELCQKSEFWQQERLLVTEEYVFQSASPEDRLVFRQGLSAEFIFIDNFDICQAAVFS